MPTENELKYALKLSDDFEAQVAELAKIYLDINQGYVYNKDGLTLRVREAVWSDGSPEHLMTVKMHTPDRLMEIETQICYRDFEDFWNEAQDQLSKRRYKVYNDNEVWEIDFFRDNGQTYFIMAEVELPEGKDRPDAIPSWLEHSILFEDSHRGSSLTSSKLSSVAYASSIYNSILQS